MSRRVFLQTKSIKCTNRREGIDLTTHEWRQSSVELQRRSVVKSLVLIDLYQTNSK